MLRPMLVEALHANGYRVMTVENNIELLAATKRVGARCILILNQSSVSGSLREVLESIQAEFKSMLKVILLCDSSSNDIVPEISMSRLQKPYVFDDLLREIAKVSLPQA